MNLVSSLRHAYTTLGRPGEFQRQLLGTWRIFLITGLVQLIGGCIAVFLKTFAPPFNAFWFGGALVSLPAVLIGKMWHDQVVTEAPGAYREIMVLYLLTSTLMTLLAWPMAEFQVLVQQNVAAR